MVPFNRITFEEIVPVERTGVGVALILYALGVSESDIYLDYELTNKFRKDINEPAVKKFVNEGLSEKAARAMMAADPNI